MNDKREHTRIWYVRFQLSRPKPSLATREYHTSYIPGWSWTLSVRIFRGELWRVSYNILILSKDRTIFHIFDCGRHDSGWEMNRYYKVSRYPSFLYPQDEYTSHDKCTVESGITRRNCWSGHIYSNATRLFRQSFISKDFSGNCSYWKILREL